MFFIRKTIYIFIGFIAFFVWHNSASAATEFVSTIRATGGDYSLLSTWEAAVQCDLTASTTVVYSGSGTGALAAAGTVELFRGGAYQNITARVIATTSTQILVQTFSGAYKVLQSGDQWRLASSTSNMWTVSGSGSQLGDGAIAVAECYNDWPTGLDDVFSISGWTTNSSNYVKIYTPLSERHNGRVNGGGFLMKSSNSSSFIHNINVTEDYTVIDGIKIERTSTNWSWGAAIWDDYSNPGNNVIIKNCLLIQSSCSGSNGSLLHIAQSASSVAGTKVYNNIVVSNTSSLKYGIDFTGDWLGLDWRIYMFNNTVYGKFANAAILVSFGNYGGSDYMAEVKNNYAVNTYGTAPDFLLGGRYNNSYFKFTNNASDDNSAGTSNGNRHISVAGMDFINTTFATADLHLKPGSRGSNMAADLSATFTTDIDGTIRPLGKAWDIGADETTDHDTQINSPQTNLMNDDGLVGYWSFNGQDMGTTSARDLSGNNNTGWLMNGTKKVSGISGQAMQFDGVNDYVDVGNGSSLNIGTNDITIEMWVKRLTFNSQKRLLLKRLATNKWYDLYFSSDNKLNASIAQNYPTINYSTFSSANTIIDSKWHHLAAVFDRDANGQIYIDGIINGNPVDISTNSGNLDNIGKVFIGAYGTDNGPPYDQWFNGLIDEPHVYNRALSAEEIGQLYRAGAKKMQVNAPQTNFMADDGLVGYWSFNGQDMNWASTTAEALDRSGNSNNGNVINGAKPVSGISGQAMQFDGVDDYVNAGDVNALDGISQFTISAFVKTNTRTDYDGVVGKVSSDTNRFFMSVGGLSVGDKDDVNIGISNGLANGCYTTGNILSDGVWNHWVVVYNGGGATNADKVKFFFNGNQQILSFLGNPAATTPANAATLKIGYEQFTRFLDGLIDEVRIYNRALSADEIGQLYQAGTRKVRY